METDRDDSNNYKTDVIQDIQSLVNEFHKYCLILVDIPIGLRRNGNLEQLCDKEARKILGNRRSIVFPVPCRNAVYPEKYDRWINNSQVP